MTDKDTIRNLEEKIRRLQQESKQAIEIMKKLEKLIDENKWDMDNYIWRELQSILKRDPK